MKVSGGEAASFWVWAALAVSRWIEDQTGWSIKKFVRTARRCRTVEIQVGSHSITAADPQARRMALTCTNTVGCRLHALRLATADCAQYAPKPQPSPSGSCGASSSGASGTHSASSISRLAIWSRPSMHLAYTSSRTATPCPARSATCAGAGRPCELAEMPAK